MREGESERWGDGEQSPSSTSVWDTLYTVAPESVGRSAVDSGVVGERCKGRRESEGRERTRDFPPAVLVPSLAHTTAASG